MEGLKVGWRKEGVEGEVIFTSESDVVRLELNKEKKNVSVFIQLCLKKKRKFP